MFNSKQWVILAVGGGLSALIFSLVGFGSFGGVLLAYFCPLPLFVIGLSMGVSASLIAGFIAGIGVLCTAGMFLVLLFVISYVAPVVVLVRQALLFRSDAGQTEWYPAGLLVSTAMVIAFVLLTFTAVLISFMGDGIEPEIKGFLGRVVEVNFQTLSEIEQAKIVENVAPILPGTIGLSWLTMLIINGALGQALASRFGWNIRPNPDFSMLVLPTWLPIMAAVLLVGSILLPGTFGYFFGNAAFLAALPFFLVGLSVIHTVVRRFAAGTLVLTLFYFLMLLFGWPVVFVAFLGLIEQIASLRQRLAGAGEED